MECKDILFISHLKGIVSQSNLIKCITRAFINAFQIKSTFLQEL